MGPVAISFGLATAAVVGLGVLASRRDHGLSAAAGLVLALGWTAGQISERTVGWSLTPDNYALIDVVSAFAVAMLYAKTEARWLIGLALVFMAQSGLHLFYQAEGAGPGAIFAYVLGLNVLFAASLALVVYRTMARR